MEKFTITVEIEDDLTAKDLKELRRECLMEVRDICNYYYLITAITIKSSVCGD